MRLTVGLVAVLTFGLASSLSAQRIPGRISVDKLPGWVRAAAERPVPPTQAPIVWLHDELIVEPLAEGGVRETRRRVGRLLHRRGKSKISDFGLVHHSRDTVERLQAWTLLADGSARRSVQNERHSDIIDAPYVSEGSTFEDQRASVVMAPGVMPGAVVAHESIMIHDLDLGSVAFPFGHADEPTVHAALELRTPAGWGRAALRVRGDAITEIPLDGGIRFVAADLPELPYEEPRPPVSDLLPMVHLRWWSPDKTRGFETWDDVGKWFHALATPVLEQPGAAASIAATLAPRPESPVLEGIDRAFEYVSQEIRYVSIQIGIGGYKPSTPGDVAQRGFGDCKDKTFLLRSLMESWGLRTYPVLVRTRGEGVLPDVPTPGAFDHAIAAVEIPEGVGEDRWSVVEAKGLGRLLLLDGTVGEGDSRNLPTIDQGTRGLVVRPDGGTLIDIPVQPPSAAVVSLRIDAVVDAEANLLKAEIRRTATGASAVERRYKDRESDTRERLRERLAETQRWFPGSSIDDYRVEGFESPGEPIVETLEISHGRAGEKIEDLLILEPGRPAGSLIDGALPPSPRRWGLKLDGPRRLVAEIRIRLPDGWIPESLPPPVELAGTDLAASWSWELDRETLVYRRRAELLSQRIPPERYEAFREGLLRLGGADRRGIVLVPASTPQEH